MISEKMRLAINDQIAMELLSHNAYLAIASFMDSLGFKVLAAKFFRQSEEEREHAMKFLEYLLDVGATVRIGAIGEPKNTFGSVEEAVETSLEQEKSVTKSIHELMALAQRENDYPTASFLKWFIDEQVEEEATMSDLLQMVRLAGDHNMLIVEQRLSRMGIEPRTEHAGS